MVFPYFRERLMRPKVAEQANFYNNTNKNEILNYQINQFNRLWINIQNNVPFYKGLVNEKKIPSKIINIEDFLRFPILDRATVKKNMVNFTDYSSKIDKWVTTGGSTGEPLKYPSWNEETTYYEPSLWYARTFYNIKRSDRMYRIWGHSHTLGEGWKKHLKNIAFKVGHPLIGYKRFSAYDLSRERLREAGKQILKFKPDYIIGYSKALQMLAQANIDRRNKFHNLKLKAIIGAAEGFDSEEDKHKIQEIFGCTVGLEYASMETKLIAHTHPEGNYRTIWRNNLIECVDDRGYPSKEGRILITTLYPRAFPLIRYELGDIISGCYKDQISVYSFDSVKGRDNDFLILDDGTPIHSEGITHAIKFSDKISAYQIRYTKDKDYMVYVKSRFKLTDNDYQKIRARLKKVDPRLINLKIKQVDQLKQTIAGKTNWLLPE